MVKWAALVLARDELKGSSGTRERIAHEGGDGGREFERECDLLRGGAEFAPSLPENIDEFFARVIGVLGGEGADFVFQEHEHGSIFEGLRAGIGFQAGFRNPGGDVVRFEGGDAGLEQEGASAGGLFHVKRAAPGEVADFALGKRGARGEPTFEMLAACGEKECGRRVGDQARDPDLDAFAVNELGGAAVGGTGRVGGVGGIDEFAGSGVGIHV